jgi:hypothetical protein
MPEDAEIKIKATGAPDAQAAVKSVADTIADLGARSGLAAGDLKIFTTVLEQNAAAGVSLNETLETLAAATGQVSQAVQQAASSSLEYLQAHQQAAAAAQQTAQSATQAGAALAGVAVAATPAAAALVQVGNAGGGAAGGLNAAAGAAGGASNAAAGAVRSFGSLYLALTLVRKALDELDKFRQSEEDLKNLAAATGIETEALARFEGAIDRSGGDGEKFGLVLGRLAKAFESASEGNKKMADDLLRLGITSRDPIEGFFQLADTVHNTSDQFAALGVAEAVTGRNSVELVGILNQGAEALRANAAASGDVAKARKDAIGDADALTRAEQAFGNELKTLAGGLLPAVTFALQRLGDAVNLVELLGRTFTDTLISSGVQLMSVFESLGNVIWDSLHGRFQQAAVDAKVAFRSIEVEARHLSGELKQDFQEWSDFTEKMKGSASAAPDKGAGKKLPGPAGKDDGSNKADETEIDGELAHNAAMAKLAASSADTQLAIQHGLEEGRIQSIENVHARAIAAAAEELTEAENRAGVLGTIYSAEAQKNIAALEQKRALAEADKNGAQEVARIDNQIQAEKDKLAERQMTLAEGVAKQRSALTQAEAAEQRKLIEDLEKLGEDAATKELIRLQKTAEDQRKARAEQEQGDAQHHERMEAMERDAIEARFKLHQINAGQRMQLLDALDAHEMRLSIEALQRDLASDAATLAQKQRIINQIQALEDKAALVEQKNNEQRMITLQQQWDRYFATINRGFQTSIDQMITGQKTFGQTMSGLFSKMVTDSANAVLQRVLVHIEGTNTIKAAEQGMSAILQALHITDAATSTAVDKTAGTQSVLTAAGVAAANAYAATSAIPFVGPELAPAAAASAYAGALSFGSLISAEGGAADIPGTTGAILHAREMVLPAELAERVRGMTGGGGSFSMGDVHVHGAGANGADIGKQVVAAIKNHMRKHNMAMA